jgi:hypothetical protein
MPLRFEETMQCGLKIIWSKVGITAASKYTEPKKKKKVYKTTRKSTVIEKKNNAQVPMSIWHQISQLPASIQNQKKKSLQDHTKINSYGEKNNAQVPISIWHQISTWQGLKSKKCFMV